LERLVAASYLPIVDLRSASNIAHEILHHWTEEVGIILPERD
jgi:EAL domain-containing protein (putative c-di-GMP-specific phosphodiesterase class I)